MRSSSRWRTSRFRSSYAAIPALAYDALGTHGEGSLDAIEVRVRLDERVIETQIGAWLERLRGAAQ